MLRSTGIRAGIALLGLLCSCAAPARPARPPTQSPNPANFDPIEARATWGDGDLVRFRIETQATGEPLAWDLTLSMAARPPREVLWAEADPRTGHVIARTPRLQINRGNQSVISYSHPETPIDVQLVRAGTGEDATFRDTIHLSALAHVFSRSVDALPTFAIDEMFSVLIQVEQLFDELMTVVETPSMWSVLANGLSVSIRLGFRRATRTAEPEVKVETVETPFGELPAFWLPITVLANDQPALQCRLLITWRRSPLLLCAGVLRIEAHHPSDPSRRVDAWLVEARRGTNAFPDVMNLGMAIDGAHELEVGMSEAELLRHIDQHPVDRWTENSGQLDVTVVQLDGHPRMAPRLAVFDPGGLLFIGWEDATRAFLDQRGFVRR